MIIAGPSQKIEVKDLLKHSLGPVPCSLATAEGFSPKTNKAASSKECLVGGQGPVARSLVSANHWLRSIKTYRFPWHLALVSANHASSNPGQASK